MQKSHLNIVAESLENGCADETAMRSLETLARRLRALKESGSAFAGVSFSGHVEEIMAQRNAVAVG